MRGDFRLPFRFLVVEIEAQMVGFARFCRLPESGYGFLIHIAVDDAHRGAGLGTELLAKVVAESAPAPLLVEIEREGRVHDWYVRQSFRPVSMSYTQPALYADTAPVPYALFASQPIENPAACVEAFYREAWELPSAHPFVRKACELSAEYSWRIWPSVRSNRYSYLSYDPRKFRG